jgi:hypothetical protein
MYTRESSLNPNSNTLEPDRPPRDRPDDRVVAQQYASAVFIALYFRPRAKIKRKVKFTLEQAMKAQRGSRGIAYSFFNLGARWEWVVNTTSPPLYTRERDPVPSVQVVGWAPRSVWTGAKNLSPRFDPRTFQVVAILYIDYAIPAPDFVLERV